MDYSESRRQYSKISRMEFVYLQGSIRSFLRQSMPFLKFPRVYQENLLVRFTNALLLMNLKSVAILHIASVASQQGTPESSSGKLSFNFLVFLCFWLNIKHVPFYDGGGTFAVESCCAWVSVAFICVSWWNARSISWKGKRFQFGRRNMEEIICNSVTLINTDQQYLSCGLWLGNCHCML